MSSSYKIQKLQALQACKSDIANSFETGPQLFLQAEAEKLLKSQDVRFRNRIFTPLLTLQAFMYQVLHPDSSCRQTLANLLLKLLKPSASFLTGGYCQARKRLKESFLKDLLQIQAKALESRVAPDWLWKGRHVGLLDGTTVSMPDTKENQREFPSTNKKRNPCEFPVARILALISWNTGAVCAAQIAPYQGKGTGESSLLRKMLGNINSGYIYLADRLYSGFYTLADFLQQDADFVIRNSARRKVHIIKKLGKNDYIIRIYRREKPPGMTKSEHLTYPEFLDLRLVSFTETRPGFRSQKIDIITSLLDQSYKPKEIFNLYRQRWQIELDFRSIKSVMNMDILHCHKPDMVRKEIWVHFLTYNMIRQLLLDCAKLQHLKPREISFKAGLQLILGNYQILNNMVEIEMNINVFYKQLLKSLAAHIVSNRPDRVEPRKKKRRPNNKYLTSTREEARKACYTTGVAA